MNHISCRVASSCLPERGLPLAVLGYAESIQIAQEKWVVHQAAVYQPPHRAPHSSLLMGRRVSRQESRLCSVHL